MNYYIITLESTKYILNNLSEIVLTTEILQNHDTKLAKSIKWIKLVAVWPSEIVNVLNKLRNKKMKDELIALMHCKRYLEGI